MKTKKRKKFNWLTTLNRLAKTDRLSNKEHSALCDKSRAWPTCACGQLCNGLPRKYDGEPTDHELSYLGVRFYASVTQRLWGRALSIFFKIEKRTTTLLRQQAKRKEAA